MNRIMKVTKLHLNKISTFALVPPQIVGFVLIVSIIIALVIQRASDGAIDAAYVDGARSNSAIVWSLPGFLIYYGVQAVATSYPFALALGTTRRNFILGTMLANALQALYIAVMLVVLLGIELATGHWFMNAYVLDVYAVGSGNAWTLFATAFVGVMLCLTIGGFFGAVWVRFGAKGPTVVAIVLGLGLALTLLAVAPRLGEIFASITYSGLAVAAAIIVVLGLAGTWLAMRRASVR
ncbi:hypothetical protein [Leucobacter sp. USHLN153]|uniref:hypothetical protein n=1 Tax=Leucobacter sp. USHLN153 TaxID=3081268 RepID=UPI0030175F42